MKLRTEDCCHVDALPLRCLAWHNLHTTDLSINLISACLLVIYKNCQMPSSACTTSTVKTGLDKIGGSNREAQMSMMCMLIAIEISRRKSKTGRAPQQKRRRSLSQRKKKRHRRQRATQSLTLLSQTWLLVFS